MSKKAQSAASPQTLSEQIHADHLIIVTNRGPVEYYMGQDKTLRYRRGEGGVVTALIEAVTFLAFLVPSRQALSIYRRYREEILKRIEDINQKFGRNKWTPIQAFVQNNRTEALAALQFYDVLLVNPLIDGMNLVAKEGSIVNQRNGVLILSRTCGAFQQLGEASIPISPADMVETAEALYKALTLSPEERRQKAELARQIVEHHDLKTWIAQQARDISSLIEK